MTIAPFIALSLLFGGIALAAGPRSGSGLLAALGGLAVAAISAALLPVGLRDASLGGEPILVDGFVRLFLAFAAVCGLLLVLIEWAAPLPGVESRAPGDTAHHVGAGFLLFLGPGAAALAVTDPIAAAAAASVAGLTSLLAAARLAVRIPDPHPTARQLGAVRPMPLRALAFRVGTEGFRVAAALVATVAGLGLLIGGRDPIAGAPMGIGLVALVLAGATGLRLGALPFLAHAARLAESPLRSVVPLLCAWSPGLMAVMVLGGAESALPPLGLALPVERGVIVSVTLATVVVAGLAAFVQDDLEHVIAYSILQDVPLVLLAFAALDPTAWGDARSWLLVAAVTKSALVAWGLVMTRTFRTASLNALGGWAPRAPVLALSLVVVMAAIVGAPGFEGFDARTNLVRLALPGPLGGVAFLVALGSLAVHLRLLAVGVRAATPTVGAAAMERLERPERDLRRRVSRTYREAFELNRPILAATAAATIALVAFSVGTGLFAIRDAASAHARAALPGAQPTGVPAGPFRPVATNQP